MSPADSKHDDTVDPIARRLARSGIRLDDDDLHYLSGARVSLDAARRAVTAGAQAIRDGDERRWPLPRKRT